MAMAQRPLGLLLRAAVAAAGVIATAAITAASVGTIVRERIVCLLRQSFERHLKTGW
jgi:hypothetical protein